MFSTQAKQDRLHLRLDSETKRKLERAATHVHKSTSEFILANALAAADEVLREHEQLTLSPRDWDLFMDALDNPPAPGRKLLDALDSHEKTVVQK